MGWYFLIAMVIAPFVFHPDPAPGLLRSREQSRNMDCERLDAAQGAQRYPGVILPVKPRGDYVERGVVACKEHVLRPGLRDQPDEAILATLQPQVTELAAAARSLRPELEERTWLVEAHHLDAQVAAKISFAAKNALVLQGSTVSDRTPILGVGDVDVITRMDPMQAYATACHRYADIGSLGEGDALLAIMLLDPRETLLHAGLCADGRWEWLR